ncbi:MAG: hypothetical protein WCT08_00445 [Patescibacteria group bacterium]|jgi:hypothetical protein
MPTIEIPSVEEATESNIDQSLVYERLLKELIEARVKQRFHMYEKERLDKVENVSDERWQEFYNQDETIDAAANQAYSALMDFESTYSGQKKTQKEIDGAVRQEVEKIINPEHPPRHREAA